MLDEFHKKTENCTVGLHPKGIRTFPPKMGDILLKLKIHPVWVKISVSCWPKFNSVDSGRFYAKFAQNGINV
jgi:hypothetical protein